MEKSDIKQEEEIKKKKKDKRKKKNDEEDEEGSEEEDESTPDFKERPDVIHDNYIILNEMGKGAFGQIFLTYNNRDLEEVAIKKEIKKAKMIYPQLKTEFNVLRTVLKIPALHQPTPGGPEFPVDTSGKVRVQQEDIIGFPKFYGYGEHTDFYYLIIQLLGPNLIELFNYVGTKKFTLTTVSMIAIQMINRVEYLHKHHYLHRDIKPENFLIGCGDRSNVVYLVDYGLCKKYKDNKTHQHIPYRENRNLTGTARYVSINTHLGIEQSRRDDLESIGYVLVFFLKGSLPWQGLKGNLDKYNKIMEKKLQIPTEILCYGLPDEMVQYLNYCKSLRFEDRPDYDYLRGLFVKMIYTCISQYNLSKEQIKFDWCFEDPLQAWNLFKRNLKGKNDNSKIKVIEETPGNNSNKNVQNITPKPVNSKYSEANLPKIDEQREPEEKNQTPLHKSSEESGDHVSEATEVKDNFDMDVEFLYDKETPTDNKANIVEDIDVYINKIKNKQAQNTKVVDKSDNSKNSEATIEMKTNSNNLITNLNVDNSDSENSVINFIKNTKKLNQAGTTEKRFMTYEKRDHQVSIDQSLRKEISSLNNKIVEIKSSNNVLNDDFKALTSKKVHLNGESKSIENEIYEKTNSKEIQDRRKSKMIELSNNHNFNNNPILLKLSKDQMIKISNDPITNHYIILGDLGNGSYGMVKKVRHRKSNEERAMKIVKKKSESSIIEIEILKKISHPNIISIYEIFEDSKNFYIMTELLEGGELFEEITNRGSFSELDAAKIMKHLLSAVNYLHNKNIVHRDLKPENIMMLNRNSKEFEIKLIDFGTAKLYEPGEKLTKFIGTSYYIAPEVLAENYDEKCDIWSAGVILYILFCGYPPFNGASNLDIYHAIKYSSPSFTGEEWKDVSRDAIDLIVNMLTKNPSKRLNCEQCMNHKWIKSMEVLALEESDKTKDKVNPLKAINKMTNFVTENKFKQSVIQFISTQFNLKEEESSLKNIFEQFDSDKKGIISIQQFTEVLCKYFGENEAKFFAEKIFSNIDNDGNGEISYNEFITSIIDKKILEKNQRIEKAFKMMDKDGSGKISLDEIRYLFGGDVSKWKKIIHELDLNGDGEIDFEEFKKMLGFFDGTEINR